MHEALKYPGLLTFEEFLAIEEQSDLKHEFVGGVLHAMAGATRRHNLIAGNMFSDLHRAAEVAGCNAFASDMLVKVGDDTGYYLDVSVVCDAEDIAERYTERLCLVVEITSPSTVDHDQREKLLGYRRIPSLQGYLIVSQEERRVIRHWRDAAGAWQKEEFVGEGTISLDCPPTTLTLDAIYRRVPDLSG